MQGAFLCCAWVDSVQVRSGWDTQAGVQLNISAIIQIYGSHLGIYQRLLQYIDDSTRDIDLSTK